MIGKKRGVFSLVLFLFLLILPTLSLAVDCILYSNNLEMYCQPNEGALAEACQDDVRCRGSIVSGACTSLPQCQPVKCGLVGEECKFPLPKGWCEAPDRGGVVITADNTDLCLPGCCRSESSNLCEYTQNKFECDGLDATATFISGESFQSCHQKCGATLEEVPLEFVVKNQAGDILTGISLEVNDLSGSSVVHLVTNDAGISDYSLSPGTYSLVVDGGSTYETKTISLSVTILPPSQEKLVKQITLQPLGLPGQISGTVFSRSEGVDAPLAAAEVRWRGPSSGSIYTQEDGTYTLEELTPGIYTISASSAEYGSAELSVTLSSEESLENINFILEGKEFSGVQGTVTLRGMSVPGAEILLDGVYAGLSQADGTYKLFVPADEEIHKVKATYANYYQSVEEVFTISSGNLVETKNLVLSKIPPTCGAGNLLNPIGYSATVVRATEQVNLNWQEPCPEVIGYELTKEEEPVSVDTTFTWGNIFGLSQQDFAVEFDKTYHYTLKAIYADGLSSGITLTVIIGNSLCENVAEDENFCLDDSALVPTDTSGSEAVYTCDAQNQLEEVETCEGNLQCARNGEGDASCKSDDACDDANRPLGLFYNRNQCYGFTITPTIDAIPVNFCVYDSAKVINTKYGPTETIVDNCQSCTTIGSCFDYQNKDACKTNSCLTKKCSWVDSASTKSGSAELSGAESIGTALVDYASIFNSLFSDDHFDLPFIISQETGSGYCVEANYTDNDKCTLCGPALLAGTDFDLNSASIFENNLCTPDVCSSLGRCLSTKASLSPLSKCEICGEDEPTLSPETDCQSYISELECTKGQPITNVQGIISESKDSCNWGRCAWAAGKCFKDGNVDEVDDCSGFIQEADRNACRVDITPPVTTLIGTVPVTLSTKQPLLSFHGESQASSTQGHNLAQFGYCLAPADALTADCIFQVQDYPKLNKAQDINVTALSQIREEANGKIYKLLYYSEDKYFNRESAHTSLVFVDNVAPSFTIKDRVEITNEKVDVKVWLEEVSELASCNFNLRQPEAEITLESIQKNIGDVLEADFRELKNIRWADLEVNCTDASGNSKLEVKGYSFDLEENIEIKIPAKGQLLSAKAVTFALGTTVDANCVLQRMGNSEEVEFSKEGGSPKDHKTSTSIQLPPGEYAHEFKAVCTPFGGGEPFEDYFDFSIDITPPETKIILKEDEREYIPEGRFWEASFIKSAAVSFEVIAEGFPSTGTHYCLSDPEDELTCPPFPSAQYQKYIDSLEITKSQKICYYSTDEANNKIISATCGIVKIDGYGILPVNPDPFYYLDEMWLIFDEPYFDWDFATKVPTPECRFDFKPEFDYFDVLDSQILTPEADGLFHVRDFPRLVFKSYPENGGEFTVYVKCKGLGEELSPEQKIHLEYDPYSPLITRAYADPDLVTEDTKTNIFAFTDRKTVCKYSDNSEGKGSSDFLGMEYSFPGYTENLLALVHEDIFDLHSFFSPTGKKDYILNTQCATGAGKQSDFKEIKFKVDFTSLGYITEISPASEDTYFITPNVPISINTSRSANCEYKLNDTYEPFSETGGKTHSTVLTGLKESVYHVPIKCEMEGGHRLESEIIFTIDLTAPVINSVEDGNFSCGSPTLNLFVYTNEEKIEEYFYEIYGQGNLSRILEEKAAKSKNEASAKGSNTGTTSGTTKKATSSDSTSKLTSSISGSGTSDSSASGSSTSSSSSSGSAGSNSVSNLAGGAVGTGSVTDTSSGTLTSSTNSGTATSGTATTSGASSTDATTGGTSGVTTGATTGSTSLGNSATTSGSTSNSAISPTTTASATTVTKGTLVRSSRISISTARAADNTSWSGSLQIDTANLTVGNVYTFKVWVTDKAGNRGLPKESNGIAIVASNYSICVIDESLPMLEVLTNETCRATLAEIICKDNTGCKNIGFSQQALGEKIENVKCNASTPYKGEKISFNRTGVLCYKSEDYSGNNFSDKKQINFMDLDGDGIANSCDKCPKTIANKIVDYKGCANGETSDGPEEDMDEDGLPDGWEKMFDAEDCQFSYLSPDTNQNGLTDGEEDYDSDTYTNYEEYIGKSDPCNGEDKPGEWQTNPPWKSNTTKSPEPVGPGGAATGSSLVAIILLIIGLLLFLGGSGYLIYYYKYSPQAQQVGKGKTGFAGAGLTSGMGARNYGAENEKRPINLEKPATKNKFFVNKLRENRLKSKKKEELFGQFDQNSEEIPHLDSLLSVKKPVVEKVNALAQKYVEYKDEIKPGLRKEEKSIFAKLEGLSGMGNKNKVADLGKSIPKTDAEDIFSALKNISKERKKK